MGDERPVSVATARSDRVNRAADKEIIERVLAGELEHSDRMGTPRLFGARAREAPPTHREAFLLKHVRDLTYEEMIEITGASVSALRMRVLRARVMLRSLVESESEIAGRRM